MADSITAAGGGEVDGFGGAATASKSYETLTTSPIGADDVSDVDDDVGGGGGDAVGGADCVSRSRGDMGGERDGGDRDVIVAIGKFSSNSTQR